MESRCRCGFFLLLLGPRSPFRNEKFARQKLDDGPGLVPPRTRPALEVRGRALSEMPPRLRSGTKRTTPKKFFLHSPHEETVWRFAGDGEPPPPGDSRSTVDKRPRKTNGRQAVRAVISCNDDVRPITIKLNSAECTKGQTRIRGSAREQKGNSPRACKAKDEASKAHPTFKLVWSGREGLSRAPLPGPAGDLVRRPATKG